MNWNASTPGRKRDNRWAGGKLYLASESGLVTVLKMGEQFEVIATNRFADQTFISSPVVAAGELFLRSATHLFCISEPKAGTGSKR